MTEFKLEDIIDAKDLQKIQDSFAKATGMAALSCDMTHDITKLSCPTEFCVKLTRGSTEGYKRCNECDLRGGQNAAKTKKPSVYYCHAGLMDFAAPIMLGDRQIGTIVGGQVLPEKPDEKKFRAIAREIGVDEDEYIEALNKIKIVPKEQIEAAADLLFQIAGALSAQGLKKLELSGSMSELIGQYASLNGKIEKAEKSINEIIKSINLLKSEFSALSSSSVKSEQVVKKTNSVIKQIKDVSEQTRILGFNASIEAARSGAAGAGFNVIAQEVRRLADDSQKRTENISSALSEIEDSITNVSKNVSDVTGSIEKDASTASGLADDMNALKEQLSSLNVLCENLKSNL